ncbi:related to RNA helicase [Melanopsichium pennsylvanicum]|uniref:ATP-dependent RNA helicase n=2 Tax=Melanopsichium pennsylvanicum TaxID=63383 RepID=A0AAJ5C4T8_9BASI|nr:related to RNA helicase [Melanopsichium pennsylvanicum 4]SNX84046.1 related to RNA helicase [Melanopsichium pennsylvanicum]
MLYTKLASPLGLARPIAAARQLSTLVASSTIRACLSPSVTSSSLRQTLAVSQQARIVRPEWSASLAHAIRGLTQSTKSAEPATAAAATEPEVFDKDMIVSGDAPNAAKLSSRTKDETFASLKNSIHASIHKALTVRPFAYTEMSAVQQSVLHLLPELASGVGESAAPMPDGQGRDMLVKAKTGTGKTIAFLVPALEARLRSIEDVRNGKFSKPWLDMLQRHKPDLDISSLKKKELEEIARQFVNNTVGTLVLSPTRELATQIADEAKKLLTHQPDLKVQLLVGGASRNFQINDWRRSRPDVVVATPGRILDLLNDVGMIREAMSACRTLILDEADTLLEMGFRDDLQAIMRHLPAKVDRQNMLFSATVSPEIRAIARASLEKDHRFVDCVPAGEENVHKHIPQYATVLESAEEQIPHILRLIAHDQLVNPGKSKTIVFAPTTKMTELLADVLRDTQRHLPASNGASVYEIHSKKDQRARFNTSDRFRKDQSGATVLVTSDVSARGVDYPGTTRVIQVGIPSNKDQYIHRIGRTGRAGAKGRSDIVLQNFERGFLHFQLDDLPVSQLHVDDLAQEVETLSKRFDESPEDFDVPQEALDAAKAKIQQAQKAQRNSRGKGRDFNAPKPPSKIRGPLSGKYDTKVLTPLLEEALSKLDEEEGVRETFNSLLGFYLGKGDELRTNKMSILEGLKQWVVQAGRLERPPHMSDSFMQKLGISMRDMRGGGGGGGFSARRGGPVRAGGRGGSDGARSFGRGRFSKDDGGREGGRDFRDSRDSRGGFRSGGGRGTFGSGRDARESRFDRDNSSSKW